MNRKSISIAAVPTAGRKELCNWAKLYGLDPKFYWTSFGIRRRIFGIAFPDIYFRLRMKRKKRILKIFYSGFTIVFVGWILNVVLFALWKP